MAKTKKISVTTTEEIRITYSRNKNTIHVDDPEVNDLLGEIEDADIVTYIQSEGFKPDEVFEEEDLNEWAISHGFIKE